MVKILLAVLIAALTACPYNTSFRDCEITCTSATGCPGGFSCEASEGLCRPVGATQSCASIVGDAGLDDRDGAAVEGPSALVYSNPAVYTKGQAITNNTPSSSGGPVVAYSIDATLPTGLALDTVTGIISGTPTVLFPASTFTITATNSGGSTIASLSITVNDLAPSALAYSTNPAVYTKGQAITNNTPSSSGGPVVSYSIDATLPTGLALDTVTGIISGTPTVGASAKNYTVTATNSGGSTAVALMVTVETPFTPSNLGSVADDRHAGTQDVILSNATINTDAGTITGVTLTGNETRIQVQTSAPEIEVFRLKSLRIQGAVTVTGSRALAIVTVNDLTITGSITFSGITGCTSGTSGDGQAGGGGGGFGAVGNSGGLGTSSSIGGGAGAVRGTVGLVPLVSGCRGAAGSSTSTPLANGGTGGGAIQLVAGGQIDVSGMICLPGGGGGSGGNSGPQGGGGGGSGGALLLEAPTVTVQSAATIVAHGGGGGGGGGITGTQAGGASCSATSGGAGGLRRATNNEGKGGDGGYDTVAAMVGAYGCGPIEGFCAGGGGGGGGVGRIRINRADSGTPTGAVSPSPSLGTLLP